MRILCSLNFPLAQISTSTSIRHLIPTSAGAGKHESDNPVRRSAHAVALCVGSASPLNRPSTPTASLGWLRGFASRSNPFSFEHCILLVSWPGLRRRRWPEDARDSLRRLNNGQIAGIAAAITEVPLSRLDARETISFMLLALSMYEDAFT